MGQAFGTMALCPRQVMRLLLPLGAFICAQMRAGTLPVHAHKLKQNVYLNCMSFCEKKISMSSRAKECVGVYVQGHEPSVQQQTATGTGHGRGWDRRSALS